MIIPGNGSREPINDATRAIDEKMSPLQWSIVVLCLLVVALDGLDTAAIGFVAPALVREFGVTKSALSPVFSAALFGMAIGAFIAGPLADKIGRKPVLIVSVLVFGLCTLGCAWSNSIGMLTLLRFLTGLGLGGAMPSSGTLLSEYTPVRYRSLLVNTMYCGFPLGAAAGGFIAAGLIPSYGWSSVFYIGGILPILLCFALLTLPESIRFMIVKKWPSEKIEHVIRRVAGSESIESLRITAAQQNTHKDNGVRMILNQDFRFGTFMLWVGYFMGLLVFYLLSSWLPTILQDAHFNVAESSRIAAMLPLGGVLGTVACGWAMDRYPPYMIVTGAFTLGALFILAAGQSLDSMPLLATTVFALGFFMVGSQGSMLVLALRYYPTECRASGSAWMLGVGRFGGILGAFGGGALFAFGYSMASTIAMIALPAFVAAVAVALGSRSGRVVQKYAKA